MLSALQSELRPMLRLALPLIVAELGWMGMEIVDTIMVSRLPNSTEAIGAAGLGGMLFYVVAIFVAGLLFGLDTLVSHAYGARQLDECHRWLIQSLYIVATCAPVCTFIVWLTPVMLQRGGNLDPSLVGQTTQFMHSLMWSALPLLLYFAFRRYLQAMDKVNIVMAALLVANLVNLAGNWALIYGHLGFPALGIRGSGWATVIARSTMALILLGYIIHYDRKHHVSILHVLRGSDGDVSSFGGVGGNDPGGSTGLQPSESSRNNTDFSPGDDPNTSHPDRGASTASAQSKDNAFAVAPHSKLETRNSKPASSFPGLKPNLTRIRELLRLGSPVAFQILFEIGVFATAGYLAARLGVIPLAAHQITLRTASVTFMVPLAISSAAAVRVGQALGRNDLPGASRAGWTALALGVGFMTVSAVGFVVFPRHIAEVFTHDEIVIQTTITLLFVAAIFQIFDGLQIVASGALRGAADTRTPMFASLTAYWAIGLPLGYYLGFVRGMGVVGIWTGLCIALIIMGGGLLWWWGRMILRLEAARYT